MFPKEVVDAGGGWGFVDKLEEPPLWRKEALVRYPRRIRLMMGGITRKSWSIRIDEKADGSRSGRFVEGDRDGVINEAVFRVRDRDFAQLEKLIAQANLWQIYPQFVFLQPEAGWICGHAVTLIFEKADAAGYRFAEVDRDCGGGLAQAAVAAQMITMADRPSLLNYVPAP
jgi:hypothetical protein